MNSTLEWAVKSNVNFFTEFIYAKNIGTGLCVILIASFLVRSLEALHMFDPQLYGTMRLLEADFFICGLMFLGSKIFRLTPIAWVADPPAPHKVGKFSLLIKLNI